MNHGKQFLFKPAIHSLILKSNHGIHNSTKIVCQVLSFDMGDCFQKYVAILCIKPKNMRKSFSFGKQIWKFLESCYNKETGYHSRRNDSL